MALDGLGGVLREQFLRHVRGGSARVNLVRYADDLVTSGGSAELPEQKILPLISALMADRHMELSTDKTVPRASRMGSTSWAENAQAQREAAHQAFP
ncbi:MAG TPA: hypothetical protein VGS41_10755 [Chthonomonadales bacterium]|nr:hypothetical protein [Chthonomonadales bacterium]